MATTKLAPVWRMLTLLARLDILASLAVAAAFLAYTAWQ
jgi:hypothetical protein